jgi:tetratricopeptide (TPR) repeat protein
MTSSDAKQSHNMEKECTKMFITTSDLLNTMNKTLDEMATDQDIASPRFELQKRLPDGSTVKADAADMAVADMESKFTQAAKEVEDLSPTQKLQWAELQRLAGNKLYAEGDYKEAIDVYLTCLVVKSDSPLFLEQVFLPIMNNLAHCTLQMGSYRRAHTFCTMALDEKNLPDRPDLVSKLYFRRGKARRLSGDFAGCQVDLIKAGELLPQHFYAEHRSIKKELELAKRSFIQARISEEKQKLAMKQFFDAPSSASTLNTLQVSPMPLQTAPALYGNQKRRYSTLRVRRMDNDSAVGHERSEQLSYWKYYLAVIGSIAERLLIFLGDDETIAQEQKLLKKEN